MQAFFDSLINFLFAGWNVVLELFQLLGDGVLLGLLAWIVFWTFAVNWVKFREMLLNGGCVALLLIGLGAVLVWANIAPPAGGQHNLLGLEVSNYIGKTMYVTALYCIMFLCGSVQLSGFCAGCCQFEEDEAESHAASH
ncbi:MAG: hypothetical protein HOL01_21790 [Planctomycetaceae bacterium]|nr:hypothetical protein [Planctomycetaceae bacterium]